VIGLTDLAFTLDLDCRFTSQPPGDCMMLSDVDAAIENASLIHQRQWWPTEILF